MQLLQVTETDQEKFAEAPEMAMDFHIGEADKGFYLVIGCRVAVLLSS